MTAEPSSPTSADESAHVTPYDRYAWPAGQIETMLADGQHQRELTAYFGAAQYAQLVPLAREARLHGGRSGQRVYILPGAMGSQLGKPRRPPLLNDIIWLDPIDIALGRLFALRMAAAPHASAAGAPVVPLGVLLYSYFKLWLRLRAAGFDAQLYDYDWRCGIDVLGAQLAARLRADAAPRIALVAHSMGGLVARVALSLPGMDKVSRLVLLGTPNGGSYAPVQALRGTYSVVRKIATVDLRHSAETLAQEVFSGFASLYHMLPAAHGRRGLDLFEPASWPKFGPQPDAALLRAARGICGLLAPPDERFRIIVGIDCETATTIARVRGDFAYTYGYAGDGTVPLECAQLPGVPTRFTRTQHGELARDAAVAAAVVDLLRSGVTRRLQSRFAPKRRGVRTLTDRQLRQTYIQKVDWARLSASERHQFLDTLSDMPVLPAARAKRARRRVRR
jgi:pimeloyl-ACP methyl ester carboxylesterase